MWGRGRKGAGRHLVLVIAKGRGMTIVSRVVMVLLCLVVVLMLCCVGLPKMFCNVHVVHVLRVALPIKQSLAILRVVLAEHGKGGRVGAR